MKTLPWTQTFQFSISLYQYNINVYVYIYIYISINIFNPVLFLEIAHVKVHHVRICWGFTCKRRDFSTTPCFLLHLHCSFRSWSRSCGWRSLIRIALQWQWLHQVRFQLVFGQFHTPVVSSPRVLRWCLFDCSFVRSFVCLFDCLFDCLFVCFVACLFRMNHTTFQEKNTSVLGWSTTITTYFKQL